MREIQTLTNPGAFSTYLRQSYDLSWHGCKELKEAELAGEPRDERIPRPAAGRSPRLAAETSGKLRQVLQDIVRTIVNYWY